MLALARDARAGLEKIFPRHSGRLATLDQDQAGAKPRATLAISQMRDSGYVSLWTWRVASSPSNGRQPSPFSLPGREDHACLLRNGHTLNPAKGTNKRPMCSGDLLGS